MRVRAHKLCVARHTRCTTAYCCAEWITAPDPWCHRGEGELTEATFTAFDRFRETLTPTSDEESSNDDWDHIHAIWDIAHRDHAEVLRREAKSAPVHHSRVERFFITPFTWAARAFAGTIMLTIWFCIIGPIWFAILL